MISHVILKGSNNTPLALFGVEINDNSITAEGWHSEVNIRKGRVFTLDKARYVTPKLPKGVFVKGYNTNESIVLERKK